MNNSKRVKCYIKNGGSSKRCLLNGVHTVDKSAREGKSGELFDGTFGPAEDSSSDTLSSPDPELEPESESEPDPSVREESPSLASP